MSAQRYFPADCTPEEVRAIRALAKLKKTWPESIALFSWSGTLMIEDRTRRGKLGSPLEFGGDRTTIPLIADLPDIDIPNGGGDPDAEEP